MNYIIVNPEGILTSEQRARAISRELYNITRPVPFQTPEQADANVFGILLHPVNTEAALVVDLNYVIPVHPLATLERLVCLFPELSDAERLILQQVIFMNKEFIFGQIVPSTVQIRDYAYMIEHGWFPSDLIN